MEKKDALFDAVKHILATMYSAQNALRSLAPEYKWSGMGNLLGDYGEFLATHKFGMIKAPPGKEFDAYYNKKKVQIKTNHSSAEIGFRGNSDFMLVLHIDDSGDYTIVYFGPFKHVLNASRRSERDNKNMITLSKLKKLHAEFGLDGFAKPAS